MSQENIDNVKRAYDALNAAYRSGDVNDFLAVAKEVWAPDILFCLPGGVLGVETATWRGYDAMLQFLAFQVKSYEDIWMEPQEFIDAGKKLVIPVRFGGRDRKSGIELLDLTAVHVVTMKDGKVVRVEAFETKDEALEAAGLRE